MLLGKCLSEIITMCRCTCAMLILLVVCFTEPGNVQQTLSSSIDLLESVPHIPSLASVPSVLSTANPTATVQPPPQPPSVFSDIVNQRVELTTACVINLEKQCVFKMNRINSRALYDSSLPISNTSGIPFKPECSSDSQLLSCCDESVQYLQEILQAYTEAYTNREAKLAALQRQNITDIEYQGVVTPLRDTREKLFSECSQVICSSPEICEFIKCKPQPCDPKTTTTTSATTKQATSSTSTTSSKATPSTTKTSSTADDNGQSQTISTTLTSTSSNMASTDAVAAAPYSPNVAAVVLGVLLSLLAAVGVAVLVIFSWRRRGRKRGGSGNATTRSDPAPDTSTDTYSHGFEGSGDYTVISDVTNHHNHINSMPTSHQPELPRALRATDSLGYEIAVGTFNSQTEYPRNSRLGNSGEYYSPLRISDRERSMTDEKQYTPLELYQNAQNQTQTRKCGVGYTSLTPPVSQAADAGPETQPPNDYIELI